MTLMCKHRGVRKGGAKKRKKITPEGRPSGRETRDLNVIVKARGGGGVADDNCCFYIGRRVLKP